MVAETAHLLSNLKASLSKHYGARLRGLFLFGSYARGDADSESDLDILVVLDDYATCGVEIDATSNVLSDLSLEYGVSVSGVFLREKDWRSGDSSFLGNIRDEAVPV
jgi:predicted nucleotidyltransferase